MRMSWKHREACQSWQPSGGQDWMQRSHRVPESQSGTQFFIALEAQNVSLRTGLGLGKRRYINTPAQEKPQEAQTLEELSSETQFVLRPISTNFCKPPCHFTWWSENFTKFQFHKKMKPAISQKRWNEGYTCFLSWLLAGSERGIFTPHTEAKSESFGKAAYEPHITPKKHPMDASYHQLCTSLARLDPKFVQIEQDEK